MTNEHDRRRLVEEGGAPESRVELAAATPSAEPRSDDRWDGFTRATDVMEQVKRRATQDRQAARRGTLDPGV